MRGTTPGSGAISAGRSSAARRWSHLTSSAHEFTESSGAGRPTILHRAYLATLRKAFPEIAKDYLGFAYDYAYYDAMTATLQALDRVHGDLSDGEKRFMAALAHVELDAPNGRTTLDASHRAIAPNTLFETLTASTSRVLRTIPAVDASFGGYFKPIDPPPGKTTPACVKRTPPPWAR